MTAAVPAARRYAAEFIGTFLLVALGPGAVMVSASTHAFDQLGISLAFGVAVMLAVATIGPVSGAHINPAVTIGLWSVRRFPARDVIPYVAMQCLAALAASAALGWLVGPVGGYGATVPAISTGRAFAVEAGYTALLGFVIARVGDAERLAPFVIGATIFVGALVTGPLTGGSFNPARSLGPAVLSGIWQGHWLYWLAPIAGMAVGLRIGAILRGGSAAA